LPSWCSGASAPKVYFRNQLRCNEHRLGAFEPAVRDAMADCNETIVSSVFLQESDQALHRAIVA
jgi:hypothetical protein